MRMLVRRLPALRWLVVLLLAALVVAACGSGSEGGAQVEDGTDAAAGDVSREGDIDRSGTLRVATDIEVGLYTYFDPTRYSSAPLTFTSLIYDTLLYYGENGLEPGLATEWSFPDDSTVELTLREGVVFQDGTPLNAEAVKFSWDRVIAAGDEMTKVAGVAALQSIEVVDELTVRVHLSAPVAGDWRDRLLFSSQAGIGIVSPTAVQAAEAAGRAFDDSPIGAGPYKFVEFQPGQRVVLERWDGYWNPDAQNVARIEFIHTQPGAPRVTALAGGAADLAVVTAADVNSLEAQGIEIEQFPPVFRTTWYQFCVSRPPFDSLEARQAVAHAIDRDAYVETAYQGVATANDKFPAPGWTYYPEAVENPYPYDPERARQLVEAAGVEGAQVTLLTGPDPIQAGVAQVLQEQLNAVGFDAQIHQSQNSFNDLPVLDWNIYFGAGTYPTTSSAFFIPGGVGNGCNYDNPELTAAFDSTRDPQATAEQLDQAWADYQQAVYDDAAQFSIANANDLIAHRDNVGGVTGDIQSGDPWIFANIYVATT